MTTNHTPTQYASGPFGHGYWRDEQGRLMAAPELVKGGLDMDCAGLVSDWEGDDAENAKVEAEAFAALAKVQS